ncbi:MAG: U32 family peptidase [Clostridia bacterium]|nr:U32 family peptidase [Clostridia bacterium]MBO5358730.1 U32 family peptidase [Clostridia bacterium]
MNTITNNIPELLCPAGDITRLKAAVDYGADAVYLAGEEFGMRTAATNFGEADLIEGVKYAHDRGVKVHVTCNTIPHNDEVPRLPDFLKFLNEIKVDAIIAADLGTIMMVKKYAPDVDLHVSVQSGVCNYETANAFYNLGAKRIVLARELSLKEIKEIREKTPRDLEIEMFAHGAMCVSYSSRCLLSSYMTGRDANRGDCAQPCRWSYSLMEEKRPGQFFNITETEKGTYILNANDMCMAEYLDQICDAGVDSIKIEGRAKSHYYVSVVTNAYRGALDSLKATDGEWSCPEWVMEELNKISHRNYSTGFYFGSPHNSQTYANAGYVRDYSVAAIVDGYQDGKIIATLKNKFLKGQEFDCLEPKAKPFIVKADVVYNDKNEEIESAPHPMMTIKIPYDKPVKAGSLLRMKAD